MKGGVLRSCNAKTKTVCPQHSSRKKKEEELADCYLRSRAGGLGPQVWADDHARERVGRADGRASLHITVTITADGRLQATAGNARVYTDNHVKPNDRIRLVNPDPAATPQHIDLIGGKRNGKGAARPGGQPRRGQDEARWLFISRWCQRAVEAAS